MSATSLLHDLMDSLFTRPVGRFYSGDKRSMHELCNELLSERGEIAGYKIASAILEQYSKLDMEGKLAFFQLLNSQFDIDLKSIQENIDAYRENENADNFANLVSVSRPARRTLLDRLHELPGATAELVSMRADLLGYLKQYPDLKRTDVDFRYMLSSWFNRGFLVLRPINWTTPANILEKIIEYEAVHAINDWDDLRRRLQPSDRRCFAFFHPSIPDDPLIFVEVAISKGIPDSIQTVLSEAREILDHNKADTAVFYSISNCQIGLAGISFGNSLIKQVVHDLSKELPKLEQYVTLSPLPGFSNWLANEAQANGSTTAEKILVANNAAQESGDTEELASMSKDLKILAASYLAQEKQADGFPIDPVARFHLSNGATLHNVHAEADLSTKGLRQSCGVMTNYLYDLSRLEKNHESFVKDAKVTTSRTIDTLCNSRLSMISKPQQKETAEKD